MNVATSRSYTLVELKMYKKDEGNVKFKRFIDLAGSQIFESRSGSERFAKTGARLSIADMMLLEVILTNYSLRVCRNR
jgi:hypothetical protein